MSLLTSIEAIELARIGKEFPPCDIQDIEQVELTQFNICFTLDFYEALLADLVDYSGVTQWVNTTPYEVGDLVVYMGRVYEAIANNTNVLPMVGDKWKFARKFTSDCYNDLWNKGRLGRWLALLTLKTTIPFSATKLSGMGVTKPLGDRFEQASRNEVNDLSIAMQNSANECLNIAKRHIEKTKNTCTYEGLNTNECNSCKTNVCNTSTGYTVR